MKLKWFCETTIFICEGNRIFLDIYHRSVKQEISNTTFRDLQSDLFFRIDYKSREAAATCRLSRLCSKAQVLRTHHNATAPVLAFSQYRQERSGRPTWEPLHRFLIRETDSRYELCILEMIRLHQVIVNDDVRPTEIKSSAFLKRQYSVLNDLAERETIFSVNLYFASFNDELDHFGGVQITFHTIRVPITQ
ncbi:hypothetical protein J6590_031066 [Homalodisca vitripennis]|nr:hypothetical protein J6590_031066 [Homalodisca vitripennis]